MVLACDEFPDDLSSDENMSDASSKSSSSSNSGDPDLVKTTCFGVVHVFNINLMQVASCLIRFVPKCVSRTNRQTNAIHPVICCSQDDPVAADAWEIPSDLDSDAPGPEGADGRRFRVHRPGCYRTSQPNGPGSPTRDRLRPLPESGLPRRLPMHARYRS